MPDDTRRSTAWPDDRTDAAAAASAGQRGATLAASTTGGRTAEHRTKERRSAGDAAVALERSLRATVRSVRDASSGLVVAMRVSGEPTPPSPRQRDAILAAACAALAVATESGRASLVSVALEYGDDALVVAVRDDGVDLVQRRVFDGTTNGLRGASDRVRQAGGRLRLGRVTPRGVIVEARVPFAAVPPS